jgi:DNA primase
VSPFIKDSSVQNVLEAANIVDVVSGYTSLRKRGVTYSGLCPFHQEKTPSFTVSAEKGLYYCFGCGEGGDLVRFLERMENLSFAEAIEQLAERYGISVEYEEGAGADAGRKDRDARLLQVLDKAATFYQRFLWESETGQAARDYLGQRGLGREVCATFRVGLSPDEWRGLHRRATKEGFSERELEDAGLLVRQTGKTYDRFRGRLMFPLVDHRGRVVGFGGRTLKDESPKYLNSPEGPLYQKGHLLYGLYQARRAIADADEVVVVEGYTDVLGLAQAGVQNVVASMGTALTDAQIGLMMRFTNNVTFMFDADRAGTEAMLRSGELARGHSLRPRVALLPAGQDPADIAVQGGSEQVSRVMAGKMSLLGFELRQALDRSDTVTADGRVRAFEEVRTIMGRTASLKEREEEMSWVADRLGLSSDSDALLLGFSSRQKRQPVGRSGPETMAVMTGRLLASETVVEREFLVAAACHPSRAATLLQSLTPEHFADPSNREVFLGLREAFAALAEGDAPVTARAGNVALAGLQAKAHGDSEAGRLYVRLVMEVDQERYSSAVLEELNLRLQEQYLKRRIAALRVGLDEGSEVRETQRKLFHLEQLLASVRADLTGLDPEERRT